MKKIVILLAVLFVLLAAGAWHLPLGEAFTGETVSVSAGDDTALVGENRALTARVYTVEDGKIAGIRRLSRLEGGKEWTLERMAARGDALYLLRMWGDARWDLLEIRNGQSRVLGSGAFEEGMTLSTLAAGQDGCWITGLAGDGSILVYECFGSEAALILDIPGDWVPGAAWARYDGQKLYAVSASGEGYVVSGSAAAYDKNVKVPAIPEATAADSFDNTLMSKQWVLLGALALWVVMAVVILISAIVCRRSRALSHRMQAVGGCTTFLTTLAVWSYVLWTVVNSRGLAAAWQELPLISAVLLGVWLLTLIFLWITARCVTHPMKAMKRQMSSIAEGNVSPREVGPGRDELHQMERSMQEMCMNLSIRDYEIDSTMQSYGRFVPQRITELLDRAVVAEVSLGDSRRITGSVGLFCVGNRDRVRGSLSDNGFVDFINHSFGLLYDCVRDNRGVLLSGGLRLDNMEAMFPQDPADGVRAGLDFLGEARKGTGDQLPAPELFLLLHKASFLYGLAGREERLFPYLSSAELEFLGSYTDHFLEAGARIVVTDDYWRQLEGISGRYIGFVTDHDRTYKLYEILDAYPKLQRDLRLKYDSRFQEGLRLFYQNDFYLARNLFSALVRACPEDGVARWYLFACERMFNQDGQREPDYSLFGLGT